MSLPAPTAPIAPPLAGQMALYKTGNSQYPYFTSGDLSSTKAVVLIGGLTAGLGGVPYNARLSEALKDIEWKLYVMMPIGSEHIGKSEGKEETRYRQHGGGGVRKGLGSQGH